MFYLPNLLPSAETVLLTEEESSHCIRVLRKQPGDEIQVRDKKKGHLRIASALKIAATREECDWIEVDEPNLKGVFKSVPDRTDLSAEINENLIVELYSK